MDLVRSWLVGALVWAVASAAGIALMLDTPLLDLVGTYYSGFGQAVMAAVIFLATVLTAAAAALVHPAPAQQNPRRHAAATLAVPAATVVYRLVRDVTTGAGLADFVIVLTTGVVGALAGWWVADRLRRPGRRRLAPRGPAF